MNDHQTVNISPAALTKTGIPIRNLWHMFLYDWNAWRLKDHWRSEVEKAPSLDALLARILSSLIQQRLRIGLGRNYTQHSSAIPGLRGRVDFTLSLTRLAFQNGRAYCEYETYSPNVAKNQIVRSSLARLVQGGEFGPDRRAADELRSNIRHLVRLMDTIDLVELKPEQVRREQMARQDTDYALMLAICNLIVQRQMPTENVGDNALPLLDRDAFTLYQVYERFIANFYQVHLTDWAVYAQPKLSWPAQGALTFLPAMAPDLILTQRSTGKLLVLDTKFTQHILVAGTWDNTVFDRNHLFQIYAYVKSQEDRSEGHRAATGVLLYPTVNHRLSHQVRIHNHVFRWETIDLAQSWEGVERDLLRIPAMIVGNSTEV